MNFVLRASLEDAEQDLDQLELKLEKVCMMMRHSVIDCVYDDET